MTISEKDYMKINAVLVSVGDMELIRSKKVNAIKALREVTGMGLKESKDILDTLGDVGWNGKPLQVAVEYRFTEERFKYGIIAAKEAGLRIIVGSPKAEKYVKQLREMACMLIMEGNEFLAKDVIEITERWGFMSESNPDK